MRFSLLYVGRLGFKSGLDDTFFCF